MLTCNRRTACRLRNSPLLQFMEGIKLHWRVFAGRSEQTHPSTADCRTTRQGRHVWQCTAVDKLRTLHEKTRQKGCEVSRGPYQDSRAVFFKPSLLSRHAQGSTTREEIRLHGLAGFSVNAMHARIYLAALEDGTVEPFSRVLIVRRKQCVCVSQVQLIVIEKHVFALHSLRLPRNPPYPPPKKRLPRYGIMLMPPIPIPGCTNGFPMPSIGALSIGELSIGAAAV